MDTDKIKIFAARVKVDDTEKLAKLERAEKVIQFLFPLWFQVPTTMIRKKRKP